VQPKREALAAANAQLEASQVILKEIQKELEKLNSRLRELTSQFEQATEEKNKVIAQAEATARRLDLANRLVGGLSSENTRWSASIDQLRLKDKVLPGDVLLAAAFISYIGAFDRTYRDELVQQHWLPFLREHAVPMSEGLLTFYRSPFLFWFSI
jgi:dynein heavy chain